MKERLYCIAVAGNPNAGKTCLFNGLTGATQHVGNYPGVTVEFASGTSNFDGTGVEVIDLPGIYSLTAYSVEEVVTRDYLLQQAPDMIINVIDASNLERNLYLTAQLIELNLPIVIALNMVDIAEKKGLTVDAVELATILGVEVVPTMASRDKGFNELKTACIATIKSGKKPHPLEYPHELQKVMPDLQHEINAAADIEYKNMSGWIALKLLENDLILTEKLKKSAGWDKIAQALQRAKNLIGVHSQEESSTTVAEARYAFAAGVSRSVIKMSENAKVMLTDSIDRFVCNRFLGPIILCLVVYSLFAFVFKLADEWKWIPLFSGWVSPAGLLDALFSRLNNMAASIISADWLKSLACDGVISGVGSVMSFVPLIFFMFMFISALEDSGYIARVAFIMDRLLKVFGMQGKSILSMIISGGLGAGGCAVPGVMAARTLRSEQDRLITILVAPFMNCGAKMPVYAMLIAAFFSQAQGAMMFLIWLISWAFALGSAFTLRHTIVRGEHTPFVMELPVYHLPTIKGVLLDTWNRTCLYIKKAATVILAVNIILWALMYYPRVDNPVLNQEKAKYQTEFSQKMQNTEFAAIFAAETFPETVAFINKSLDSDCRLKPEDCLDKKNKFAALVSSCRDDKLMPTEVKLFIEFNAKLNALNNKAAQEQLHASYAGRIGDFLVPITQYAGFQWRENIALIGGLAAKEVVLGTMATAYALGNGATDNNQTLSTQLAADSSWNRTRAFAMLVFVMAYAPCLVTLVAIRKETGKWRWAIFSAVYSTILAFIVAVIIYQIGSI